MAQLIELNVRVLLCAALICVAGVSRAEPPASLIIDDSAASVSVQPGDAMVAPVKRVAPQMPENKYKSENASDKTDAKIKTEKSPGASTKKAILSKTVKKKRN